MRLDVELGAHEQERCPNHRGAIAKRPFAVVQVGARAYCHECWQRLTRPVSDEQIAALDDELDARYRERLEASR